ncbi:MAG: endoglucanase [Alphaproteobacteria bacterium]|jgi:endoglucanase|nr:endoglucanase [Alphaproteobacteria bacterium]
MTPPLSRRSVLRLGAALPALGLGLGALPGRPAAAPSRGLWMSEWLLYRSRFIRDGRVIDTGNGNISHSEGQGYGMLLAEAYDDRPSFEALWAWTRDVLGPARDDGLLAWKWDPGPGDVTDPNAASDGDLLVAWALLRGAVRWNEPAWRDEALGLLEALERTVMVPSRLGPMMLPGPEGFTNGPAPVVNPSYWVFPALDAAARATDRAIWTDLIASGLALCREARFGAFDLTADWVALDDPPVLAPGFDPVFGFNAVRVPLYLAWARHLPAVAVELDDQLAPYRSFWAGFDGRPTIPAVVDLATGTFADFPLSSGGRAVAVATRFAGRSDHAWALIPRLAPTDDYYAATLLLLSKLALLEVSPS